MAKAASEIEALCRDHRDQVLSLTRKFVDASSAEDVAQEALIVTFHDLVNGKEIHKPLKYVQGVARYVALNTFKPKRSIYGEPVDDIESVEDERSSVEDEIYAQQLGDAFAKAIEEMPPKCSIVFTLFYFYDLSGEEIAEACSIALKTVWAHLNKGKRLFYSALQELDLE